MATALFVWSSSASSGILLQQYTAPNTSLSTFRRRPRQTLESLLLRISHGHGYADVGLELELRWHDDYDDTMASLHRGG